MAITISQLAQFESAGLTGIINEVGVAYPLAMNAGVVNITGNTVTVPRITANTKGVFRKENEGKANAMFTSEGVPVNLELIDASWWIDVKTLRGSPMSQDETLATCAKSAMSGALETVETVGFYGHYDGATLVFPGLDQLIPAENVIDKEGTGDTTDVYVVNQEQVKFFIGGGESGVYVSEIERALRQDASNKDFWTMAQEVSWTGGVMAVNRRAIAKIANISKEKPVLETDVYAAFSRLGSGTPPTAIYMSRSGARMLEIDRVNRDITGRQTGFVENVGAIPVYVSDGIKTIAL